MEYIQEYAVYVAGVGIIIGLFLIFMGYWFFKCTMFFAGLFGTALVLLVRIYCIDLLNNIILYFSF